MGRRQDAEVIFSSPAGRRSSYRRLVLVLVVAAVAVVTACSAADRSGPTGSVAPPASSTRSITTQSATLGVGPLVSVTDTTTAASMFPDVVSLGWLDGVSAAPAIRVPDLDLVHWHGSRPGEAAELLPGGAYRWTGPTGSMVGCAARPKSGRAKCVGVDPAGNTAVTDGSSAVRVVYGPGGGWRGNFDVNGSPVPADRPAKTLAQAVSATGVDMASLVDFVTRQPPFAGGVTGDPHLITAGGTRVTSQQLGEFEARIGDPAHQVQIRMEAMPYRTDIADVTAAVIGAAGHRIEFLATGALLIDGAQNTGDGRFQQIALPGGVVIGWWPPDPVEIVDAVVLWPDGAAISMAADSALGLTLVAHLPTVAVGGLFGTQQTNADATGVALTPTPKIPDAAPSGSHSDFDPRPASSATQTMESIVQSWRIRAGESMFAEVPPVPVAQTAAPAIPTTASVAAEKYCAAADMSNSDDVASCVFDVARTGDAGYVAHHGELASAAEEPAFPLSVAADWPALGLGAAASPTPLGLGAQVDVTVPAGNRRVYLLTIPTATALLIRATPCSGGASGDQPASGAAALRLFDGKGHPVSTRLNCGRGVTDLLAVGSYYLVLAGSREGASAAFKLRVAAN